MLLEIGVFDAYASAFEYAPPTGHRQNDLRMFYSHPKWKRIPGTYTDDCEMSVAIAELLVERKPWTPINIAQKFVDVFHRNNQRTGYSRHFYEFLCNTQNGKDFLSKIKPDSEKSGAAMRAGPLGVIADTKQLLQMCELQARITHNTDKGVCSAQAAALMAHYFIYDLGPKNNLGEFLENHLQGKRFGHDFSLPWKGKVHPPGLEAVCAAITAIQSSNSMAEVLIKCVNYGGDTDTVAAISAGPASFSKEILQNTPENLILTLENSGYGKDFLVKLDTQLFREISYFGA